MALSIKVKETGPPFTTTMTCGMNDKSAVWQTLRLRVFYGMKSRNLTGKVHWYQFHVVSWSILCSCYSCSHSRQHPNRNNMFQKENIQNTFPAEMHLQNVFFFFFSGVKLCQATRSTRSLWLNGLFLGVSFSKPQVLQRIDWLTQWRFLAKWDVQNTLTPHLRIYHSSMVCWCLSVYSIYISYLFGERDDIHIFYTINCCIQRMYPWLETQPLKFSSSSPSYRNCDSVCLSSLQSIPWRRPNKQRHTRNSTFCCSCWSNSIPKCADLCLKSR